jgi:hypothetical protein
VKVLDPRDLGVEALNPRRMRPYLNRLIWRIHNDLVEYGRRPTCQKALKLEPYRCIINQEAHYYINELFTKNGFW